jgi:hypothetical protein
MDFRPLGVPSSDETIYYILYDLRADPSLSPIHLPEEDEGGPVLLLVDQRDCSYIFTELKEMFENEGAQWVTTVLIRPEYAPANASDLLVGEMYIVILHLAMLAADPEGLPRKMAGMRKYVVN